MKGQKKRVLKLWQAVAAFVLIGAMAIVYGCGGGGGGGSSADTTAAAGTWRGTVTDKLNITYHVSAAVSTNGQMYMFVDEGICYGNQYIGTFSMNEGTGFGYGNINGYAINGCEFYEGFTYTSGTYNFTISGNNLTGNYSIGGDDQGIFNLTYDPVTETSIILAHLEGNWGNNSLTISISSDGIYTGKGFCNLSGKISIIDPDWSITNVTMTLSGCEKSSSNGQYSGLGVLVSRPAGDDKFVFLVSNPDIAYIINVWRLPFGG